MLLIPKIGVPADLYALDMLVTQIEQAKQRDKRIGFEVLIETALGWSNVEAIGRSSRRLEAMCFGAGDFAASMRMRTTGIGGLNPDYGVLTDHDAQGKRHFLQGDPWHAAQVRVVAACRAYGLRPVDGPYGNFKDTDGFLSAAKRAAVLGSPAPEEVERARRIVDSMEQAAREGRGAVQLDGRLIDIASIRMAQNLLKKAEAIAASSPGKAA
jgi:malyl-CoA/(S)-citramalyl-CoA lyase